MLRVNMVKKMRLLKSSEKLIRDPSVVLLMGAMGSGKTSFGHLLLEQSNFKNKFVVLPEIDDGYSVAWNSTPRDIITPVLFSEDIVKSLPMKSAIFIDDASVVLYARDHGMNQNKLIDKSILMSRQRKQTLIFATHNARKIDIGALGEIYAIFMKEPAFLQDKIERSEFKVYVKEAKRHFDLINKKDRVKCVYMISGGEGKFLQIPQAKHWKEELGDVWVLDESGTVVDTRDIVSDGDSCVEQVYKTFVDTGYPLTVYAIKNKLGSGTSINDVTRAVDMLVNKRLLRVVPNKGTLDKYRLV